MEHEIISETDENATVKRIVNLLNCYKRNYRKNKRTKQILQIPHYNRQIKLLHKHHNELQEDHIYLNVKGITQCSRRTIKEF